MKFSIWDKHHLLRPHRYRKQEGSGHAPSYDVNQEFQTPTHQTVPDKMENIMNIGYLNRTLLASILGLFPINATSSDTDEFRDDSCQTFYLTSSKSMIEDLVSSISNETNDDDCYVCNLQPSKSLQHAYSQAKKNEYRPLCVSNEETLDLPLKFEISDASLEPIHDQKKTRSMLSF